jgi:hypothetical protein
MPRETFLICTNTGLTFCDALCARLCETERAEAYAYRNVTDTSGRYCDGCGRILALSTNPNNSICQCMVDLSRDDTPLAWNPVTRYCDAHGNVLQYRRSWVEGWCLADSARQAAEAAVRERVSAAARERCNCYVCRDDSVWNRCTCESCQSHRDAVVDDYLRDGGASVSADPVPVVTDIDEALGIILHHLEDRSAVGADLLRVSIALVGHWRA